MNRRDFLALALRGMAGGALALSGAGAALGEGNWWDSPDAAHRFGQAQLDELSKRAAYGKSISAPVNEAEALARAEATKDPIDRDIYQGWASFYRADYDSAHSTWEMGMVAAHAKVAAALAGTGVTVDMLRTDLGRFMEGELAAPARADTEKVVEFWARYRAFSTQAYRTDIPQAALEALLQWGRCAHGRACAHSVWGRWRATEQWMEQAAHSGYAPNGTPSFDNSFAVRFSRAAPLTNLRRLRRLNARLDALEHRTLSDLEGDVFLDIYGEADCPAFEFYGGNRAAVIRDFARIRAFYSGDDDVHLRWFKPWLLGNTMVFVPRGEGETMHDILVGITEATMDSRGDTGPQYQGCSTHVTMDPRYAWRGTVHELLGHGTFSHLQPNGGMQAPRGEAIPTALELFLSDTYQAKGGGRHRFERDLLGMRRLPLSFNEILHFDFCMPDRPAAACGYANASIFEVSLRGLGNPWTKDPGWWCFKQALGIDYDGAKRCGGRFEDVYGLSKEDAWARMHRMSDAELWECYDRADEVITRVADRLMGT